MPVKHTSQSKRISLETYRDSGSKIFSGRPRGERVRQSATLAALEDNGFSFEIFVPEDLYSVTSSFFLGMFGDSIRKLGEEEFRRRYKFCGKNISRVVEEGIREAQKSASPLP
jgi:hypothetical protein